jgi:hypothetical protein
MRLRKIPTLNNAGFPFGLQSTVVGSLCSKNHGRMHFEGATSAYFHIDSKSFL